jgi:glycosyltransferase involved in cell wall biosynthesis
MDLSIIVPVGQRRSRDIAALYREYHASVASLGLPFEFIFVLDGPRELSQSLKPIEGEGRLTVIELTRPFGEATALMAGFQRARGRIIVTLPAYEQIEPSEIRKLIAALDSADLAIGHRWPRAGNRWEFARRRVFHGLIAYVTGQRFRDLGCGARAMKRRVLEEISLYGDQHRFLPVLANRHGFKVVEVDLRQSPKDRYDAGYRAREYLHRVLDIFSVFFLVRFTKKPLRFFGMIGAGMLALGALLTLWLVAERLIFNHPLSERPALLLSSLLVVLGLQVFALGLLGELVIFTHARELRDYQVDQVIEFPAAEDERATVRAPDLAMVKDG